MALLQVVRGCSSTGGVRVNSGVGRGSGVVVAWVCGEGGDSILLYLVIDRGGRH